MTLDQAQRILRDPKYVRGLIAASIERLAAETLNAPLLGSASGGRVVTPEDLLYRQGVVAGLRIADSFFVEALKVVEDQAAQEAAAERAAQDGVLPPALVAALTTVLGGPPSSDGGGDHAA